MILRDFHSIFKDFFMNDNIAYMGLLIGKYNWSDEKNYNRIFNFLIDKGVNPKNANEAYDYLHDNFEYENRTSKFISHSEVMELFAGFINKYGLDGFKEILKQIACKLPDWTDSKLILDSISMHILNDCKDNVDYFNGINDYTDSLKDGIIYEYYRNTTDKRNKRCHENWRYVYAIRGIKKFEASRNQISRVKLNEIINELYDNKHYEIMMTLGNCIVDCNNGTISIDKNNIDYKWLVSMEDYPEEFIRQAIIGVTAQADNDAYINDAKTIVSSVLFNTTYTDNLLRISSFNYGSEIDISMQSSCNLSWVARNGETVHLMAVNMKTFTDNMYSVYSDNTMSTIMSGTTLRFTYKPYYKGNHSVYKVMDYYKKVFADKRTTRRFAAWCWMILILSLINDAFRTEYSGRNHADKTIHTEQLDDYINDGIIPSSFMGVELPDIARSFMSRVISTDDDIDCHHIMRELLRSNTDANDEFMRAMIGSFVRKS